MGKGSPALKLLALAQRMEARQRAEPLSVVSACRFMRSSAQYHVLQDCTSWYLCADRSREGRSGADCVWKPARASDVGGERPVRILRGVDTVDKANRRRQRLRRTRGVGRVTGRQVSIELRRRWHGGQWISARKTSRGRISLVLFGCWGGVIDRPRMSRGQKARARAEVTPRLRIETGQAQRERRLIRCSHSSPVYYQYQYHVSCIMYTVRRVGDRCAGQTAAVRIGTGHRKLQSTSSRVGGRR